jgi:hypothetical protein
MTFAERSDIYSYIRKSGFKFDMVNPSLNEPWSGTVFVALVYTSLLRGEGEKKG